MRSPPTLAICLLALAALACCSGGGGSDGGTTTGGGSTSGGGCQERCGNSAGGSSGSGGGGAGLSGACTTNSDCASPLQCATEVPGGYCTELCSPNQPCAIDGGICVEPLPGQFACGLGCTTDSDCARSGFSCDPTCQVCIPTPLVGQLTCAPHFAGGGGRLPDGGACGSLPGAGELDWSASVNTTESAATLSEAEGAGVSNDAGTLVLGFMVTVDGGAQNEIGAAVSTDDGVQFNVDPPIPVSDAIAFDPSLAIDENGLFYYTFAGYDQAGNGGVGVGHVFLMTSSDGVDWTTPSVVNSAGDIGYEATGQSSPGGGIDKPFAAINPHTQQLNTVFSVFAGEYGGDGPYGIFLAVGTTPSAFGIDTEIDVSGPSAGKDLPTLAFDQQGNGYAAWAETTDPSQFATDQSTGTSITGTTNSWVYFAFLQLVEGGPVPPAANAVVSAPTDEVVFDVPRIAVTPDGSAVYVAYVVGNDSATDIALAAGDEAGANWTPPVIVNDDPHCATHYHPAVSLDAAGNLWVTWVSNRDGTGRVYYAVSTNGGQSFSASATVTDDPFYFTTLYGVPAWIGGYQSLFVGSGELYSLWTGAVGGDSPQSPAHVFLQKASAP